MGLYQSIPGAFFSLIILPQTKPWVRFGTASIRVPDTSVKVYRGYLPCRSESVQLHYSFVLPTGLFHTVSVIQSLPRFTCSKPKALLLWRRPHVVFLSGITWLCRTESDKRKRPSQVLINSEHVHTRLLVRNPPVPDFGQRIDFLLRIAMITSSPILGGRGVSQQKKEL